MTITPEQFLARIRLNPVNHLLLEKLPALGLPAMYADGWLPLSDSMELEDRK
ncbi:hypothetical protein [Rhizobium sp. WSM1325]|uniref:hypothetical protein n=1 Tax=Rhizobium sp. WSM1325 TaxID=3444086 RepID=UPI0032AFB7B9